MAHSAAPEARGANTIIAALLALCGSAMFALAGFSESNSETLQVFAGATKPGFALSDLTGANVSLAEHRGEIVLVHFFATWCEPCRDELASLRRLVDRAANHRVTVLAISVAEVPARVQKFIAQTPVNFPVLLDQDRAVAKTWDVSVLPTTFVLDRALKPRLAIERDFAWDRLDLDATINALSVSGRSSTGAAQDQPAVIHQGE